jgi:biotin carboxyl carrier protein
MKERWKIFHSEREIERNISAKTPKGEARYDGKHWWVHVDGYLFRLQKLGSAESTTGMESEGERSVIAPMTGTVTAVLVDPGSSVEKGAPLFKMEAMKMQYTLSAPRGGIVGRINCKVGDVVEAEQILTEIAEKVS